MPSVEMVQKYGLHSDVHCSFPLGEGTEAVHLSQNITLSLASALEKALWSVFTFGQLSVLHVLSRFTGFVSDSL